MTRVPFAGSITTGLLATVCRRIAQSRTPGVLTLCYHGLRRWPKTIEAAERETCTSSAGDP